MTKETSNADQKPDWEAIVADWRAGVLSGRAIADKFGVPEATLRKLLDPAAMTKGGIREGGGGGGG